MVVTYGTGALILGLSTDTKPTTIPTNSVFFETDTNSIYLYNGTTWIQSSANRQAYHYLIFKDVNDGNKYKARNGSTGQIDFTHATDCGILLNSVAANLRDGSIVEFQSNTYVGATDFTLSGTKTRILFRGCGSELNFKIRISGSGTTDLYGVSIQNFYFNGANAGVVINNTYQVSVIDCSFALCTNGISVESAVSYSEFYNFQRCYFKNCTTAIRFKTPTGTGTGSYVNGRIQDCGFDAFSGTTTPYIFIDIQSGAEVSEGHWDNLRLWFSLDNGTGINISGITSRCSWSRFYFENFVSGGTLLKAVKNNSTAQTAFWLDNPTYGGNAFNSKYDNAVGKWIDGMSSIVRENVGPAIGINNAFGATQTICNTSALYTGMPRIYIIVGGTFSSETVTVTIQAFAPTGESTGTVTKTYTATSAATELLIADYDALGTLDVFLLDHMDVKAKTTKASASTVTVNVKTLK